MNVCVYVCTHLHNRAMWPFSNVALPCVQGPWTQHRGNLIPLTKKREGGERKEERINQARRKTKATGQWGPKCHLASTWGEKKGEGKRKKEI